MRDAQAGGILERSHSLFLVQLGYNPALDLGRLFFSVAPLDAIVDGRRGRYGSPANPFYNRGPNAILLFLAISNIMRPKG